VTTPPRPIPARQASIEQLEHALHTDIEAVTVQLRAVGRAIEALTAAVDELGTSMSRELPAAVAAHLEQARWELKSL
jgi:predicted nuclease with RNAse H fold